MRRTLAAFISLILVLMTVLIGCSQQDEDAGKGKDAASNQVTEPGTFPIVKDPVTLKVMVSGIDNVEDYATNSFTKWYEEKTNVKIQWEVVPRTSAQEKLNLVLASGDYPDVILNFGISPTLQMIYGSQGAFVPLNKLIDKYGVETKKMMKDIPQLKDMITAPDGNIYGLPYINQCFQCSFPQRMWIYKPWLDKLGLKMPTTTDEFYQVLKAFKEKDPNGNGKADDIPLMGASDGGNTEIESFLMNSFVLNESPDHLLVNNGKIGAAFMQPEWKDGLSYLHKLYTDGLISQQSFTQTTKQLKEAAENPDTPIVGAITAFGPNIFSEIGGKSGRWLDYVALPPLKGPKGVQLAALHPNIFSNANFVITNNCKIPEIAFRWADGFYQDEVTMRSINGMPGKQWKEAGPDDKGLDGRPAKWVELQPFGTLQNDGWNQTGVAHMSDDIRLSKAADPKTPNLAWILYKASKELYEPHQPKLDSIVPVLYFNNDQASELAPMQKSIDDFVDEMTARFITGDQDLDKGWNDYLSTLEGMNVKRYLQLYQTAYDAKYKKK